MFQEMNTKTTAPTQMGFIERVCRTIDHIDWDTNSHVFSFTLKFIAIFFASLVPVFENALIARSPPLTQSP